MTVSWVTLRYVGLGEWLTWCPPNLMSSCLVASAFGLLRCLRGHNTDPNAVISDIVWRCGITILQINVKLILVYMMLFV